MRRKLAAGNWKMNGSGDALVMIADLGRAHSDGKCDIVICPPSPFLAQAAQIADGGAVAIGAQDCHPEPKGTFTGDSAAAMLAEAGANYIIVGHSERREAYGESDALVAAKASAALNCGLTAIICLGESLQEREAGDALPVISRQLSASVPDTDDCDKLVVAYEPIWAIGTGKTPTPDQIAEVHTALRKQLLDRFGDAAQNIRLLYGGSVKPDNAAAIFALPDVDGALVGGASLSTKDFSPIVTALANSPEQG